MMENKTIEETVFNAMEVMTSVSDKTDISHVPAIAKANNLMRSVGLGMMNLHGFLAKNYIPYGSPESLEFVDTFFNMINYHTLKYSMLKAKETQSTFHMFEESTYADGSYFENRGSVVPTNNKILGLFEGIHIPTDSEWLTLKQDVMKHGLYHQSRMAVAPNGSISYVMSATASILPIRQVVEERTYGNSKTFYPMPYVETAGFMYESELSYDLDNFAIMRLVATAQKHVDQGISFELCVNSNETTRNLKRYYLYAHHLGIKTLYYVRTNKLTIEECESCAV